MTPKKMVSDLIAHSMITISHPIDDLEVLILKMALEAEDIPYLIVGEHFGSLYPGMQIPAYNERSIRVHHAHVEKALAVVGQVRTKYSPSAERLTMKSRLRMLLEAMLFGWVMPCGTKKSSDSSSGLEEVRRQ